MLVWAPLLRAIGFDALDDRVGLAVLLSELSAYRVVDYTISHGEEIKYVLMMLGAAEARFLLLKDDAAAATLVPLYTPSDAGSIHLAARRRQALLAEDKRKLDRFQAGGGHGVGGNSAQGSSAASSGSASSVIPTAQGAPLPASGLRAAYPTGQPAAGSETGRCSTTPTHYIVMGVHFKRPEIDALLSQCGVVAKINYGQIYYLLVGSKNHAFRLCVVSGKTKPFTPVVDWFTANKPKPHIDLAETAKHVLLPQYFA